MKRARSYDERINSEIVHWKKHASRAKQIWNWEGPNGRARLKRRAEFLGSFLKPGARCLEVGCGTGLFSEELAKSGASLVSIDISPDLMQEAKKRVPGVEFLIRDACHTGFAEESFDAIVGSSVLHHLEVPAALKEFHRILKPGGTLAFTEPNMMNPHIFIQDKVPFIREAMGVTKYETAFVRWPLGRVLKSTGPYKDVRIVPFDFLYPLLPDSWLGSMIRVGAVLERVPVLKEFAGSLQISAVKQ